MADDGGVATPTLSCGAATVPEALLGCWIRRSVRFADGTEDTTTSVIWVQTLSGVGDIRIPAARPELQDRAGLSDCSREELLALAEQDCFCGVTLFDTHAQPFPTASWPKDSYLFRFQPIVTFPEPGWIEWLDGGRRMIERAPSGAYEEDWRLQSGSQSTGMHLTRRNATTQTCLYVADDHAIFVRNRLKALPADKSLLELVRDTGYDEGFLREMLDCEFSYARRQEPGGRYVIEASTFPWREGRTLECPSMDTLEEPPLHRSVLDDRWLVESFWRS